MTISEQKPRKKGECQKNIRRNSRPRGHLGQPLLPQGLGDRHAPPRPGIPLLQRPRGRVPGEGAEPGDLGGDRYGVVGLESKVAPLRWI